MSDPLESVRGHFEARLKAGHGHPPKAKGSTTARGYGAAHQRERKRWAPIVATGTVDCHAELCLKAGRRIKPGEPWDLGHTRDRAAWTGPEHRECNRTEPQFRSNNKKPEPPRSWRV